MAGDLSPLQWLSLEKEQRYLFFKRAEKRIFSTVDNLTISRCVSLDSISYFLSSISLTSRILIDLTKVNQAPYV